MSQELSFGAFCLYRLGTAWATPRATKVLPKPTSSAKQLNLPSLVQRTEEGCEQTVDGRVLSLGVSVGHPLNIFA
jgi:hypothetical protein